MYLINLLYDTEMTIQRKGEPRFLWRGAQNYYCRTERYEFMLIIRGKLTRPLAHILFGVFL